MFGMLNPARPSLAYRSAYARCCQHHRRVHGVSALPWLSYEAVLLYQVAADAGAVRADGLAQVRCCKLRPLPADAADRDVGAFCAHVGALLASIKVSDDHRDGRRLRSRLLQWLYGRRFAASWRYFTRLDGDFERRVGGFIADHLALEDPAAPIGLADYTRPTAAAFGYVCALMARLPGLGGREELLRKLGEHVGAAIIAFDCAVDRDRDRRRGDYNPLADGPGAVAAALAFSREQLRRAEVLCAEAFGPPSLSARTLEGVGERVAHTGRRLSCPRCADEVHGSLQGWGLAPPRGAVQFNSLFGLAGLAALALGLAARLMASGPPAGGVPPLDPGQPPGVLEPMGGVVKPPAARRGGGGGSCGDERTSNCCDGVECCCLGADCASSGGESAGGCGDCGGCDCNCGS